MFTDPTQGKDKSSALAALAVQDEWFVEMPLGLKDKEVIEQLRGRWILEAAELSGMNKAGVEHLKVMLSRRYDSARLAYDRLRSDVPRQCIIVGTTNREEYLRDTTGNRRYWPVRVRGFNLDMLKRDRDQLWAEAAAREAKGVSIRLDPKLWPMAGEEQAKRLTDDPYFEALQNVLGDMQGKISSETIWAILDIKARHRGQDHAHRMSAAMRALGWRRANKSSIVRIGGKLVVGFVKGEQPWAEITISYAWDGKLEVQQGKAEKEDDEPAAQKSPKQEDMPF